MTDTAPDTAESLSCDLILVGGGLANGLLASRLTALAVDCSFLVIESGEKLGGNHTWSFYSSDLEPSELAALEPFIEHRWPGYEVRFPRYRRLLPTGYNSFTSERFHAVLADQLGDRILLGAAVTDIRADGVTLADGRRIAARCVIDGRGPAPSPHLALGFQKFTGLVVKTRTPHGLEQPIIMDATVPQDDGYRFVYSLPTGADTLLIEDTRYSDSPALDTQFDEASIRGYAEDQGWEIEDVLRREDGILPITLGGDFDAFWAAAGDVPVVGLRAALFHATTGYSLPDAARLAARLATRFAAEPLTSADVLAEVRSFAAEHWRRHGYFRLLNRMLFIAAEPARRYIVMQRFYRLRERLIERFYAGKPRLTDRLRILTGKPPVAILPALRCLPERSAFRRKRT